MSTLIKTRRDTLANWELNNPVLADGEQVIVFMPDGRKNFKFGDGTSAFNDLRYTRDYIKKLVAKGSYMGNGVLTANGKLITWQGAVGAGSPVSGQGAQTGYVPPSEVMFPRETGRIIDASIWGHNGVALFDNGHLYGWGTNSEGLLGLGHGAVVYTPTLIASDIMEFRAPTQLTYHISSARLLVKKTDGYWYGAGYNGYGQLGNGNTTNQFSFVKFTTLGTGVKNIWNLGAEYGCIIADTGSALMASGYNGYGQFGLNNTSNYNVFVDISAPWGYTAGTSRVMDVQGGFGGYSTAVYSSGTLVMLIGTIDGTSGTVKTCGFNSHSQCGNGSATNISVPYTVGSNYTKILTQGGYATSVYAITTANALSRWGYNGYGQLGNGNTNNVVSPLTGNVNGAQVNDVFGNTAGHTYGWYTQSYIKQGGKVSSAGYNGHGQCGLGHVSSPVMTYTSMFTNEDVIDVSSNGYGGNFYNLFLTASGKVYATGYNGQHGISMDGTTTNAMVPRNLTPFLI